jgi:hypothetical protein
MKKLFSAIDRADVFTTLGLCLLGTGLWWHSPWVSLTVVGSILTALGILGSIGSKP